MEEQRITKNAAKLQVSDIVTKGFDKIRENLMNGKDVNLIIGAYNEYVNDERNGADAIYDFTSKPDLSKAMGIEGVTIEELVSLVKGYYDGEIGSNYFAIKTWPEVEIRVLNSNEEIARQVCTCLGDIIWAAMVCPCANDLYGELHRTYIESMVQEVRDAALSGENVTDELSDALSDYSDAETNLYNKVENAIVGIFDNIQASVTTPRHSIGIVFKTPIDGCLLNGDDGVCHSITGLIWGKDGIVVQYRPNIPDAEIETAPIQNLNGIDLYRVAIVIRGEYYEKHFPTE